MKSTIINCPSCGKEIELSQAISHEVEEKIAQEIEKKFQEEIFGGKN